MPDSPSSKIIYLTSGAGGMFCGSCMHDNALAAALSSRGWDIQLVPTYTPIRTDETDVSVDHVFFGGINVFLQQKIPLLRMVPSFLDRFLDNPWLIRRVTSRAMETDAKMLGELSLSMLKGPGGNQRKEVKRLVSWLKKEQPDLLVFSNILIGGAIPEIKRRTGTPVLVTLQGDDVFLDSLAPQFRTQCIELIRQISAEVDGFLVHSEFFRGYMSQYFGIEESRIHVTPLGVDTRDFVSTGSKPEDDDDVFTIGYLARLAPQKGLHHLVDAFIEMNSIQEKGAGKLHLRIAGWLSPENKGYSQEQFEKLDRAGLSGQYEYIGAIEREEKLTFLHSLDLLSVPTEFLEPKGLYVLEAMAAGVPVVQPDHACFPELIQSTGGGVLFEPKDATSLARRIAELIDQPDLLRELGRKGRESVLQNRNSAMMARDTSEVFRKYLD